jgi:hypothetical protein
VNDLHRSSSLSVSENEEEVTRHLSGMVGVEGEKTYRAILTARWLINLPAARSQEEKESEVIPREAERESFPRTDR